MKRLVLAAIIRAAPAAASGGPGPGILGRGRGEFLFRWPDTPEHREERDVVGDLQSPCGDEMPAER